MAPIYLWLGSIQESFLYKRLWILTMFSKVPSFQSQRKLNHWPGGQQVVQVVCSEGRWILAGSRAALQKVAWKLHESCMKAAKTRFHEMSNTGLPFDRHARQKHERYQGKCVCVCLCVFHPARVEKCAWISRRVTDNYWFGTRMSFGCLVRKSAFLPADRHVCHLHLKYSWFASFLLTTSSTPFRSSNWPNVVWTNPVGNNMLFPVQKAALCCPESVRKVATLLTCKLSRFVTNTWREKLFFWKL